ncbi:MAG TPA: VWA domain-containing protein [Candidatus Acidoferrum sp.]|nr:VWA domain-containing protein [Candidatus Acidoferrum sp.]
MNLLRQFPRAMFPIVLFLAVAAPQIFGQSSPPAGTTQPPSIKVRTGLVLIPALVTDAKRARVTDMKKEDFVVLENGKRQEIALFEHITTKAEVMKPTPVPPGVFTNTVQQGGNRVTIFVLDLVNSKIEEQKEARKQLLDFLSKSLDEQEPVCLVAVNSKGAWLLHGFTTDPKILLEALRNVKNQRSELDSPARNPEEEIYRMVQGTNTRNAGANAAMEASRLNVLEMESSFQDIGAGERIRLTLLSMLEIADAFVGIPGRKSLIWATAGFPFDMGDESAFEKSGALHSLGQQGLIPLYDQTWRTLEAANIAVYPLDVSELVNPGFVGAGIGMPLPRHTMLDMHVANLENFASMTGGKFCDRSMDAEKCFKEAASDSSDYYLLGIYDKSGTEKPGWRKLSVRTMRTGLEVRARSGYYLAGAVHDPPTDTKLMEMALFSPFAYTGLPVSVRLLDASAGSKPGVKKVCFVYSIPAAAVRIDDETGNQLKLEFGAVARNSTGKMVGNFSKVVEGKMSEAQARQVREKGILFTGTLELSPGEYSLSFAVIDKVNENTGSVAAPLKVE